MFTTLPRSAQNHFQSYDHTPQISSPLSSSPLRPSSSPLSPRDANIQTRDFPMSSPTRPSKPKKESFKKRPVKRNPLMHKGSDSRETQRKLFLKKVREGSENKRWEARGGDDEIMRSIWLAEQRRWAERITREGEHVPSSQEDDLEPEDVQRPHDDMIDAVIQQENEEIEALISLLESEGTHLSPSTGNSAIDTPYGSDEEEYDNLFMEVMNQESNLQRDARQESLGDDDTIMDIS